jgi:thiamine-phosphate diphosphorylase
MCGPDHHSLSESLAVYLVADPEQSRRPLERDVDDALAAGVRTIQLRAKQLSDRNFFELGHHLRISCRSYGALFIVNDRIDIALALEADGVHLGVNDLPLPVARRLGGDQLIIGFSPETDEEAIAASEQGADYVGVGPVFVTSSKLDAFRPIGVAGVRRMAALSPVPLVGIGGITAITAGEVIAAGAAGIAVIGAVLRAPAAGPAAAALVNAVHTARLVGQR